MTAPTVVRDERTTAIENASYRWAYLFMSYGLLLSVAYRGLVRQESSWDLLALVIVGGIVATLYQGNQGILTRRWAYLSAAAIVIAAILGVVLVLFPR